MTLPLTTLTTLNRQQLGEVFKDPRTLLAFERIQLQVATIIPATFTAFQNLDFVVTVADPTVPNAHVITAGANISVTPATGLVTLKATPTGASGQIQYNNAGTFGAFTTSGDATINTATGVLTLATVATAGTYGDSLTIPVLTLDAKGRTLSVTPTAIPLFTSTVKGLVPLSGGGTVNFLRADGTWAPAGTGTVTHTAGSLTSGQLIVGNGSADIKVGDLSGDVSTSGSGVTTIGALKVATGMIQASAVTLAKIANASASSKVLGSGASGSGAAYSELSLGTGLSMSGTTLSASGVSSNIQYTRVQLQATVAVASNNFAAKSWLAADIIQDDATAWASGNPTRFTTPAGYTRARITLNATWASNGVGVRWAYVVPNAVPGGALVEDVRAGTNEGSSNPVSVWLTVTAGDYFEIVFAQSSGGNLNLTGAAGALATAVRAQIEWMP